MAVSLYDATVALYIRQTTGVQGILAKAKEHFENPDELMMTARLIDDMAPLAFQLASVHHHSINAVKACSSGLFTPPNIPLPETFADGEKLIADTLTELKAVTAEDMEAVQANDVAFKMTGLELDFTVPGFLLSFSMPNFQFHATTTYDVLRAKGLPLAKRDFMGGLDLKKS